MGVSLLQEKSSWIEKAEQNHQDKVLDEKIDNFFKMKKPPKYKTDYITANRPIEYQLIDKNGRTSELKFSQNGHKTQQMPSQGSARYHYGPPPMPTATFDTKYTNPFSEPLRYSQNDKDIWNQLDQRDKELQRHKDLYIATLQADLLALSKSAPSSEDFSALYEKIDQAQQKLQLENNDAKHRNKEAKTILTLQTQKIEYLRKQLKKVKKHVTETKDGSDILKEKVDKYKSISENIESNLLQAQLGMGDLK